MKVEELLIVDAERNAVKRLSAVAQTLGYVEMTGNYSNWSVGQSAQIPRTQEFTTYR